MKIKFEGSTSRKTGALVLMVAEGGKLGPFGSELDSAADGLIARVMKASGFEGKLMKTLTVLAPAGVAADVLILAGLGKPEKLAGRDLERLGGTILGVLAGTRVKEAAVVVEAPEELPVTPGDAAAWVASGVRLRDYTFDKYKTKKNQNEKDNGDGVRTLRAVNIRTTDPNAARKAYAPLDAVAQGVHLARDLVNEPPNVVFPQSFSDRAMALKELGAEVEILDEKDMEKLGMGALLAVGRGSERGSRLVVIQWKGGRKSDKSVAFVGKGVTFDTGGISIKPAASMQDMKGDMAGAACVAGLMHALAARKAKVNAVGVVGLVENMPDGRAYRPGDVLTSMSGQTIEVHNTDAEGRLVLADALWYTQDRFKPKAMIDLATLTGAILIALGKEHAGLFSNNDDLSEKLIEAGQETGEKVWRLPLDQAYDKLIDSDIADMKNVGGRNAGSITAAQFLQRFANGVVWAHLDIAGTGMDAPKSELNQTFGSGWGVRLLNGLVSAAYER